MAKRRKPHVTPEPLFVVSDLPDYISLERGTTTFTFRCNQCRDWHLYSLPVTSGELQRAADEFKAAHRHDDEGDVVRYSDGLGVIVVVRDRRLPIQTDTTRDAPRINIPATGPLTVGDTRRFVRAIERALKLAEGS